MSTQLRYHVVKETLYHEDIGLYESYGFSIVDERGIEVKHISDISTEAPFVEKLAEVCEREQVSLLHIFDVIEDALP